MDDVGLMHECLCLCGRFVTDGRGISCASSLNCTHFSGLSIAENDESSCITVNAASHLITSWIFNYCITIRITLAPKHKSTQVMQSVEIPWLPN